MKKIVFILFLNICVGNIVQAQFLKNMKAKAKAAVDNSVDRSTNKVIDKAINSPVDNTTDTVLDKTSKKVNSLFKKKKTRNSEQNKISVSDSTAIKTAGADSALSVVPAMDSTAIRPKNQN